MIKKFLVLFKEYRKLERKLEIAESTLRDIAIFNDYIVAQGNARQALKQMEEVE